MIEYSFQYKKCNFYNQNRIRIQQFKFTLIRISSPGVGRIFLENFVITVPYLDQILYIFATVNRSNDQIRRNNNIKFTTWKCSWFPLHRLNASSKENGRVHFMSYLFFQVKGWKVYVDTLLDCGQCCGSGSGIRCLFDPWIRDLGWVEVSIRIRDPG